MSSRGTLVVVSVILLGLTLATVLLARVSLGLWSLPIAFGIAAAKASLIAYFFMHVRCSPPVNRLVIAVALFWFGILLVGTGDDYLTRHWLPIAGK
jgi:cytochrome c oxidase subunit IV